MVRWFHGQVRKGICFLGVMFLFLFKWKSIPKKEKSYVEVLYIKARNVRGSETHSWAFVP